MLSIDYDQSVDTFKDDVEVFLKRRYLLKYTAHLNDLLVTQKVESRELLSFVFNISRETLH